MKNAPLTPLGLPDKMAHGLGSLIRNYRILVQIKREIGRIPKLVRDPIDKMLVEQKGHNQ